MWLMVSQEQGLSATQRQAPCVCFLWPCNKLLPNQVLKTANLCGVTAPEGASQMSCYSAGTSGATQPRQCLSSYAFWQSFSFPSCKTQVLASLQPVWERIPGCVWTHLERLVAPGIRHLDWWKVCSLRTPITSLKSLSLLQTQPNFETSFITSLVECSAAQVCIPEEGDMFPHCTLTGTPGLKIQLWSAAMCSLVCFLNRDRWAAILTLSDKHQPRSMLVKVGSSLGFCWTFLLSLTESQDLSLVDVCHVWPPQFSGVCKVMCVYEIVHSG